MSRCGIEYMSIETLRESAKQYADLKRHGITISNDDILIGSLAIEKKAILVTNNTKHFINLSGIQLENWVD